MPNVVPTFSGTAVRLPGSSVENQVIVNNGPGNAILTGALPGATYPATGLPFPAGSEVRLLKNSQSVYAAANSLTPVTAAAVPASTTPITPNVNQDTVVRITGGTVTAVVVNAVTVAATSGVTVVVPANKTISITYSVAPTWTWFGAAAANLALSVGTSTP